MAGENGSGWWSFQVRMGYQTVPHLPTLQKGFQREFAFVYYGGDWGVPIVRPEVKPNFGLNFWVLELSDEEAAAVCYMQTESKMVNGVTIMLLAISYPDVPSLRMNIFNLLWDWVWPLRKVICRVGLVYGWNCCAYFYSFSNFFLWFATHSLAYFIVSDPAMAKRLNFATLKMVRLRSELGVKVMQKLDAPKVWFLSEPCSPKPHSFMFYGFD